MFGPPPGNCEVEPVALRVYRTWNYQRVFSHIVILVGAVGMEVSYRYSGSNVIHKMPAKEWDRLDTEPCDHMKNIRREI